jgi:hypothetical protein
MIMSRGVGVRKGAFFGLQRYWKDFYEIVVLVWQLKFVKEI